MRYYPVSLNITQKDCLVVGGGAVGTRKAETLLKCGAIVTVISEEFSDALTARNETGGLVTVSREYSTSDLDGMFLVVCATSNRELNQRIGSDAKKKNILCNIADLPDESDFVLPSVVNRGDLTISISTSGKSPALAKKLRKDLAAQFGEEYALFLHLMGAIREKLLAEKHDPATHKKLFTQLIEGELLELTGQNDIKNIDLLLQKTLGKGFVYQDLIHQ